MSLTADETFMRRALALARADAADGQGAGIACVIVLGKDIIAEGCNEVGRRHDPTAHAEIVAIRNAGHRLACDDLAGATLYSTLQPCGMCTMASIWGKIGRIVYGAGRDQVHKMYFEDRHLDTMDFIADAFRKDLTLQGGVLAGACAQLYHKPGENVPQALQGNL